MNCVVQIVGNGLLRMVRRFVVTVSIKGDAYGY